MIDHITINVSNYEKSRVFYEQALRSLGLRVVLEGDGFCGFGKKGPEFEIAQSNDGKPSSHRVHVAFKAESEDEVRAFYTLALEAGALDNGAPGLRPEYEESYYAAFVLDPDGNNIEACIWK